MLARPIPAPTIKPDTAGGPPRNGRRGVALLVVAALVVGAIGFVVVAKPFQNGPGASSAISGPGEIFLEPVAASGPDPFTPSVATALAASPAPASPSPTVAPTPIVSVSAEPSSIASAPTAIQATAGGTVGLYGGTRNNSECDKDQLVSFLEANPDKAKAWAAVHGIDPAGIRDFVAGLTPVVLNKDTRVTNHGFRNGVADARQSVLQAGTAVLVDRFGVPRARCFCGNPLLEPIPVPVKPTYTGDAWPGFAPEKVEVIAPAAAPLDQIPIVDVQTGDVFGRTTGEATVDVALASSPSPETSSEPTPVTPTEPPPSALPGPGEGEPVTRDPAFPSDLTAIGAIGSNSVDPNFPVDLAVDLDTTTSWFSIGPHTTTSITEYTWSVDAPVEIGAVAIVGNADNATPDFRTGFGFGQVEIEILSGGVSVTTATYSLDGTPDPDILAQFPAGTMGDTVRMLFSKHESLDCGGVGEVLVLGPGWQDDINKAIEEGLGNLFGP